MRPIPIANEAYSSESQAWDLHGSAEDLIFPWVAMAHLLMATWTRPQQLSSFTFRLRCWCSKTLFLFRWLIEDLCLGWCCSLLSMLSRKLQVSILRAEQRSFCWTHRIYSRTQHFGGHQHIGKHQWGKPQWFFYSFSKFEAIWWSACWIFFLLSDFYSRM